MRPTLLAMCVCTGVCSGGSNEMKSYKDVDKIKSLTGESCVCVKCVVCVCVWCVCV